MNYFTVRSIGLVGPKQNKNNNKSRKKRRNGNRKGEKRKKNIKRREEKIKTLLIEMSRGSLRSLELITLAASLFMCGKNSCGEEEEEEEEEKIYILDSRFSFFNI